jgi:hypothetical protein
LVAGRQKLPQTKTASAFNRKDREGLAKIAKKNFEDRAPA